MKPFKRSEELALSKWTKGRESNGIWASKSHVRSLGTLKARTLQDGACKVEFNLRHPTSRPHLLSPHGSTDNHRQ